MTPEAVDSLLEIAALDRIEAGHFGMSRHFLDGLPEARIQRNRRKKLTDARLGFVVGGAQLGRGGYAFQMADQGHGVFETLGDQVERDEGILKRARAEVRAG